ncbi:MAG: hypothetical protein QM487_08155 [Candidatus Marithrix sp.]
MSFYLGMGIVVLLLLAFAIIIVVMFVINKPKISIKIGVMLIMVLGTIYGTVKGYDWYKEYRIKHDVIDFLAEMNPDLNRKMIEIKEEIELTEQKIQQLLYLKEKYPKQKIIYKTIEQWQILSKELNQVSDNIYHKVEGAYVAYEIDEIQGEKKFSIISKKLLKEANSILANAEITKNILEKELLSE